MRQQPDPVVDPRDAAAFVAALLARRPGYVPEWRPGDTGPDVALTEALGGYLAAITTRLNQVPVKHQLALLAMLGVVLMPAQAARAPVVFTLAADTNDSRVPAGTRLAADPPDPEPTDADPDLLGAPAVTAPPGPVLFETERGLGLAAARLVEVRSFWPGRDQFIDHTPTVDAGHPFVPWRLADLQDAPHHLYVGHSTLLAISGNSDVALELELSQGSSEPLDTVWEYWDGAVWRPFRNSVAACDHQGADLQDGTAGFRGTGTVHLLTDCAETAPTTVAGIENFWIRGRLTEPLLPDLDQLLPEVEQLRISTITIRPVRPATTPATPPTIVGGFAPDAAVVDGTTVDLGAPFYPFGMNPQPGAVFYFSSAEAFGKPGAQLHVCYVRTQTPQDELAGTTTSPLTHHVAWEYWNGREWAVVPGFTADPETAPADLNPGVPETNPDVPETNPDVSDTDAAGFGTVVLTVPEDMEPTTVADVEGRWMRVRLVSGGFGFTQTVTWTDTRTEKKNTLTYVVSTPPALTEIKLGYSWTFGPFPPERVLTYNDFQYTDGTDEAIWPGRVFRPFTPPPDLTPALYLGFDKPLPVDRIGLLFDIWKDLDSDLGPALTWEFWNGSRWRTLTVADGTRRLRLPGLVELIGPRDGAPLARFGTPRWWLRARLAEDGPPGSPTIRAILPNATWVVQQQTIVDDPIGTSTGLPDQTFAIRQIPVLPGEQIEVRELAGARAAVEWRIVARELFPGDQRALREIEALLGREAAGDITYRTLRLRRDRDKNVVEVWVRWTAVHELFRSGPHDRHYILERSRGRLQFGGSGTGKVPPAGAAILARRYQSGGGRIGNVPTGAITKLQGSVAGLESVHNPMPAEGGSDGETLGALRRRGPATLRHRGRGLSVTDLAALAREASPAVAAATALAGRTADGRRRPGHITLVIVPATAEPRPQPSFGLREQVRRYVEARAEATVAGLGRIEVTGPEYQPVDVEATIVADDPAESGPVAVRARAALERLLHPVHGGPDGTGWAAGRGVALSDVAAVLERVAGVDHVEHLALSVDGRLGGEQVVVAAHRTVVAGTLHLELAEGVTR
ncbi:putative baseplate assembly protein (plasmid) [Rhodococcus sp. WB1]|uniref:putative baseplate assembly protein n=1 Tax=Rhodococcus sp. WB1 TaxID=1033922 RepID=UPI00081A3980|nr:putative baseplate assembly protein [Rhodococcus sp. WB1]ANZ28485.1 putative baseplate assembly protein [Rhodococcus sp. WB1]